MSMTYRPSAAGLDLLRRLEREESISFDDLTLGHANPHVAELAGMGLVTRIGYSVYLTDLGRDVLAGGSLPYSPEG